MKLVANDLVALQRATHAVILALDAELSDLGLSASETNLMACLDAAAPRRIGEIVADTGQRPSTVTGILDRLERRGLVARQLDADDRRSFRVALTTDGAALQRRVLDGYASVAARIREGAGEQQGTKALRRLLRAIDQVGAP
jgi:DNA-binding MarR family transcriptional regulator